MDNGNVEHTYILRGGGGEGWVIVRQILLI